MNGVQPARERVEGKPKRKVDPPPKLSLFRYLFLSSVKGKTKQTVGGLFLKSLVFEFTCLSQSVGRQAIPEASSTIIHFSSTNKHAGKQADSSACSA
mmetsp:Transcript_11815/g.22668  ORF Transcript_11815/g.22668 Transcript_11815/m.22668 type:complete len:97 (+) Transcript_11815:1200-1490(+)